MGMGFPSICRVGKVIDTPNIDFFFFFFQTLQETGKYTYKRGRGSLVLGLVQYKTNKV